MHPIVTLQTTSTLIFAIHNLSTQHSRCKLTELDDEFLLTNLYTDKNMAGQGHASAILLHAISMSDSKQKRIILQAKPYDSHAMSVEDLRRFYCHFGFEPYIIDKSWLVYNPKGADDV